jgi:trypsin
MLTRSQKDERVKIFNIAKKHAHPDYNRRTNENDIALIKIRGSVNFTEHLYPICLPTSQIESPDVIISGFGQTGHNHQQTENLMKIVLNRFTQSECQDRYVNTQINPKTMLCYGSRRERKDACRVSISLYGTKIRLGTNVQSAYC